MVHGNPSDPNFVTGYLYFLKNHSEEYRNAFLWRIEHWLLRVFEIKVPEDVIAHGREESIRRVVKVLYRVFNLKVDR
jgi:hypothetical protein